VSVSKQEQQAKGTRARRTRGPIREASWLSANAITVLQAIEAVSKAGGALRFGLTRDGGAYAIGIYENGQAHTEYLRPGDDLSTFFAEVAADFGGPAAGDPHDPQQPGRAEVPVRGPETAPARNGRVK